MKVQHAAGIRSISLFIFALLGFIIFWTLTVLSIMVNLVYMALIFVLLAASMMYVFISNFQIVEIDLDKR